MANKLRARVQVPLAATAILAALCVMNARAQDAEVSSGTLQNVVIKGSEQTKPSLAKPPLKLDVDPYAAIRASLKPDDAMLLADSPQIEGWSQARSDIIHSSGLVAPWEDVLKVLPAIVIPARADLSAVVAQSGADRKGKGWSWSLNVVDEQGKPIEDFQGRGIPPENLVWNGQGADGRWIEAGHSYSPLYHWTNGAQNLTAVGRTLEFPGVVHPEQNGFSISLDLAQLFGSDGQDDSLAESGKPLLRAAVDWYRRESWGAAIAVSVDGGDAAQAQAVRSYLASELSLSQDQIVLQPGENADSSRRVVIQYGGR